MLRGVSGQCGLWKPGARLAPLTHDFYGALKAVAAVILNFYRRLASQPAKSTNLFQSINYLSAEENYLPPK
jgi:hypothetical protein